MLKNVIFGQKRQKKHNFMIAFPVDQFQIVVTGSSDHVTMSIIYSVVMTTNKQTDIFI